jgi:uncharacterized protein with HEPN domain
MERDPRAYLWDIREAAAAIEGFIGGVEFDAYVESAMMRYAVERGFEIIGEAMSQLSRLDPALAARAGDPGPIIAFRNQLIHRYGKVDHQEVWKIAHTDLPRLRGAVAALLGELGPP